MDADALDRLCGPAATAARAAAATGGLRGDGGASLMFDRKGVPSKSLRHRPGGFVRGGGGSTGVGGSGGDGKVVVEGAAEAGSGVGGKVGGDVAAAS